MSPTLPRAQDIAALVSNVADTEHRFLLHGDRHSSRVTPWMPYQPADFIGIIWECMPVITSMKTLKIPNMDPLYEVPKFLDVGCGPGTKMAIAEKLFGFYTFGIEIDPGMAFEAAKNLATTDAFVEQGDALEMDANYWKGFDVIWLYRPFRDADSERELETLITSSMKPGAILAGGSWETDPGPQGLGWEPIVDDTLNNPNGPGCIWRGAWRKP